MRLPARSPVARAGIKAGYLTSHKRAEAVGCSRVWLLKIEQGCATPSKEVVGRMAALYRIPETTLWNYIKEARKERLKRELLAH